MRAGMRCPAFTPRDGRNPSRVNKKQNNNKAPADASPLSVLPLMPPRPRVFLCLPSALRLRYSVIIWVTAKQSQGPQVMITISSHHL